ncbi:hypothetical protein [Desulfogranum marinum]|uniref:hypothetical protein n=1 Tax=Desulfogranum marinum TaxID=453220 RepID=UPI0029C89B90|nr:hypothetical protein [Desulfogranum marinum]
MLEIISLFTAQYGLTKSEVMREIENVFSVMLSQWHGCEVMVFFNDDLQLEAVAYHKTRGVVMQAEIDFTRMRGLNTLKKRLEKSISKVALLKQTTHYKYYEKELRWGEVTGRDAEHNLYVETEVIPGETILATCPLNRIGVHERTSPCFSVGAKRAFHLRRVEPILLKGTPRLNVVVDRVSKTLVEALLKEQLGHPADTISIRCIKRYVGRKSFVLASKRIPKSAILAVTGELGEKLEVRFGNGSK